MSAGIAKSVDDLIGNTPMVYLTKVTKDIDGVWVACCTPLPLTPCQHHCRRRGCCQARVPRTVLVGQGQVNRGTK